MQADDEKAMRPIQARQRMRRLFEGKMVSVFFEQEVLLSYSEYCGFSVWATDAASSSGSQLSVHQISLTLQRAGPLWFFRGEPVAIALSLLIVVNVSERHEPSFDLFEGDAGVSASSRVGCDPWERAVQELLGSQGRDDDEPKL